MAETHTVDPYDAAILPEVIVRYLREHGDGGDWRAVLQTFSADGRVTDEGIRYEGTDRIRDWLTKAASEYTYATTLIGQRQEWPDQWVVSARLQGNFPGGTADLRYRFTVREGEIAELTIAP